MNLGQSYEISESDGEWLFKEELAGRKCSCTLRIVGDWVPAIAQQLVFGELYQRYF